MSEPAWLLRSVIDAIHDMQLAEHGGAAGVRDVGLLDSALARPINTYSYGTTDLCDLAASYAYGLIKNHPYIDGNKRIAFLAAYTFLKINGLTLKADEISATQFVLGLASGEINEDEFADWLRRNCV